MAGVSIRRNIGLDFQQIFSMADAEPRVLFVFSRASQGGCCCYGGCHAESRVFVTAQEAKIALRAALHKGVWFPLTDSDVYDLCYVGARGSKKKTIAALRAGACVEESFDFDAVNISGHYMNPDSWEEDWNGDEGTVAITKTPKEDDGDHGGLPRVDILSVKKVVVGAAQSAGSDSDTVTEPKSDTDKESD